MADKVKLQAYAPMNGPDGEYLEEGDEFEATEEQARFYTRANWAGPAGTDAREIQLEVAAEEYEQRSQARKFSRHGRNLVRNLLPNSAARGNVGASGRVPAVVGEVENTEDLATNQQTAKLDVAGGSLESSKLPSPQNSEAQKLQDEAESEHSSSESSSEGESQEAGQAEESAAGTPDQAPKTRASRSRKAPQEG